MARHKAFQEPGNHIHSLDWHGHWPGQHCSGWQVMRRGRGGEFSSFQSQKMKTHLKQYRGLKQPDLFGANHEDSLYHWTQDSDLALQLCCSQALNLISVASELKTIKSMGLHIHGFGFLFVVLETGSTSVIACQWCDANSVIYFYLLFLKSNNGEFSVYFYTRILAPQQSY